MRIGVYICHCGLNIANVINIDTLRKKTEELADVAIVTDIQFMCSDSGQESNIEDIKEHNIDRVVVAACYPRLHEQNFKGVIEKAGGFTDDALIREAKLIRKSSKLSIDKEYLRLKQIPRDQLSKREYEYLVMKEGSQDIGRIVVDFHKLCILKNRTEDIVLKNGDLINIPEAPNVVYVTGRISNAGGVLYEPGKKIKYYLKKAGGVTWDAKSRSIKVTKVSGEIIDDEDVKSLEPGDIIWVPRKPDRDWWEIFRQTIAVVAQVATVYIVVDRALIKD